MSYLGTSGSGKSTLLHLLERFYDVQRGSVVCKIFHKKNILYSTNSIQLIDKKDLRDINVHWWRSQVGMVSQEAALFNISIADNIAYGDLSRQVTIDEIIEAAKNANIHDFIQSLPQVLLTYLSILFKRNYMRKKRDMTHLSGLKAVNYRVVKSNA